MAKPRAEGVRRSSRIRDLQAAAAAAATKAVKKTADKTSKTTKKKSTSAQRSKTAAPKSEKEPLKKVKGSRIRPCGGVSSKARSAPAASKQKKKPTTTRKSATAEADLLKGKSGSISKGSGKSCSAQAPEGPELMDVICRPCA
ncbi:hypothetical protein EJ03DRAFT_102291 [Teratosphaeria nubilosa]|uniref:Uncharacterized protein n=1 Tax=Teratosphaeria nubilosa TaxID=161662 RepID=A0A6G1LM17_9PEZI|nr:hypothetical protein EJ03DRAFT_102291 [Teratosphaeria nubilosa]